MIKKIKVPLKINAKINNLIRDLIPQNIKKIKEISEQEWIIQQHAAIGVFIRNGWELYKRKGDVYNFFKRKGIIHADDMSGIILSLVYRRVRNEQDNIEELIQYYINYWKEKENGNNL